MARPTKRKGKARVTKAAETADNLGSKGTDMNIEFNNYSLNALDLHKT
jgi:hypothetical protein